MRSSSPSRRISDAACAALVAVALAAPGCASAHAPAAERRVAAAPDAAFAAAERVLASSWPVARRDPARRRAETEWFFVKSDRSAGLLLERPWIERLRVAVAVGAAADAGASVVAVTVDAERKPPGGARAYRFERTEPPEGFAAEVLDAIDRSIERSRKGEGEP